MQDVWLENYKQGRNNLQFNSALEVARRIVRQDSVIEIALHLVKSALCLGLEIQSLGLETCDLQENNSVRSVPYTLL